MQPIFTGILLWLHGQNTQNTVVVLGLPHFHVIFWCLPSLFQSCLRPSLVKEPQIGPVRTLSDGLTRTASKLECLQQSSTQTKPGCCHHHGILKSFARRVGSWFWGLHLVQVQSVDRFFFYPRSLPINEQIWASCYPNHSFSFLFVLHLKSSCALKYNWTHLITPIYTITITQHLFSSLSCTSVANTAYKILRSHYLWEVSREPTDHLPLWTK